MQANMIGKAAQSAHQLRTAEVCNAEAQISHHEQKKGFGGLQMKALTNQSQHQALCSNRQGRKLKPERSFLGSSWGMSIRVISHNCGTAGQKHQSAGVRALGRQKAPAFLPTTSLDDVFRYCEDEARKDPYWEGHRKASSQRKRFFGREELTAEILEMMEYNVRLGVEAPRNQFQIMWLTGGSKTGKSAMMEHVSNTMDDIASSDEPADDPFRALLKKGAYVVYHFRCSRGDLEIETPDGRRSAAQRVGVRLFACLLNVDLRTLNTFALPKSVLSRLTPETVIALGARLQRQKMGLAENQVIHWLVTMDGLTTAQRDIQENLGHSNWPPVPRSYFPPDAETRPGTRPPIPYAAETASPAQEAYAEKLVRKMIESVAAVFTAGKAEKVSKAGAAGVVGSLILTATGPPHWLGFRPGKFQITERILTGLGAELGVALVEEHGNRPWRKSPENVARLEAVADSRELRTVVQLYGGIPLLMMELAEALIDVSDYWLQERQRLHPEESTAAALCALAEKKVWEYTLVWGQNVFRGDSALGGIPGTLELVKFSITGVPVPPDFLLGGRVPLSRAQTTGVIYTKPFTRDPLPDVTLLTAQSAKMKAAVLEATVLGAQLPTLPNRLPDRFHPDCEPNPDDYPNPNSKPNPNPNRPIDESWAVLAFPPAIQEGFLKGVSDRRSQAVDHLKFLRGCSWGIFTPEKKKVLLRNAVQQMLTVRAEMLLATGREWVRLEDFLPGAIGDANLLQIEVYLRDVEPAPLIWQFPLEKPLGEQVEAQNSTSLVGGAQRESRTSRTGFKTAETDMNSDDPTAISHLRLPLTCRCGDDEYPQ